MQFAARIFTFLTLAAASIVPAFAVSPLLQPLHETDRTPLKMSSASERLLSGLNHNLESPSTDRSMLIAGIKIWKPEIPEIQPVEESVSDMPEYIDDMLGHASSFIGTRYRSGGKKPGGFDCSGFTSYIFRQFGVSLAASSRSQYTQGEQVLTDDLRPGDLVFFSGRAVSKTRVGHVGIVTEICPDGTFRFIHSACSTGVIISHSQEPYYSRRYIGARRVE